MFRRGLLATLIAAAVASSLMGLAACGSSIVGGASPQVVPLTDRDPAVPVAVPRLSGPGDISVGRPSARPTVVNLWASWCGPCKEEMPAVQRFSAANPEVRVVGIAIDDSRDAARQFAREVGVGFPLGFDADDRIGDGYAVSGLPTTLLLDQQGRLASTWAGPVTQADLEQLVAPLTEAG